VTATRRRRLVVLTPYAVWPPRLGGPIRVAGLLGHLGEGWEVEHFSQAPQRTDLPLPPRSVRVSERWTEHKLRDPVSWLWIQGVAKLAGYPAVGAGAVLSLLPRAAVRRAIASADAVLVSPHYQFSWVRRVTPPATPLMVDQHNVEREVWPARGSWWSRRIAASIAHGEQSAWAGADLVLAVTEREAAVFRAEGARRVAVVPNGVDVERIVPVAAADKARLRARLGMPPDGVLAVFLGGAGYANRNGLAALEAQAEAYADRGVQVAVVGRLGAGRESRRGMSFTGEVDDVVPYLQAADVALCPLLEGGGTSLKMVEYLAAGLPVVSTAVGARGLELGDAARIVPLDEMPEATAALAGDADAMARLAAAGRRLAEQRYSWQAIGAQLAAELDALVADRR